MKSKTTTKETPHAYLVGIIGSYGTYMDEDGNPVSRPKDKFSYSYDFFVTWKTEKFKSKDRTAVYSDRLWQWNHQKYDSLCQKHWQNQGQNFYDREPKQIEAFLRDYHDLPNLELVMIQEGCNVSSGYPIWLFFFIPNKSEEKA